MQDDGTDEEEQTSLPDEDGSDQQNDSATAYEADH